MIRVVARDLALGRGRTLRIYDTPDAGSDSAAVCWHHGSPNVGHPPAPLFACAQRLGLRWISYDRPGYGGSTPVPDRTVANAAVCSALAADALGIERFAVVGHSGGGTHALACAALLPERVPAAVSIAGLAPFGASGLDWFGGMADSGVASLQAAARGRAEKERFEDSGADYDPEFIQADLDALAGPWSWLETVVRPAVAAGPGGLIDDDLAYVAPWGFEPAELTTPVLFLHGDRDRVVPSAHSHWLANECPAGELRLARGEGHLSVLESAPDALEWLRGRVGRTLPGRG